MVTLVGSKDMHVFFLFFCFVQIRVVVVAVYALVSRTLCTHTHTHTHIRLHSICMSTCNVWRDRVNCDFIYFYCMRERESKRRKETNVKCTPNKLEQRTIPLPRCFPIRLIIKKTTMNDGKFVIESTQSTLSY